MISSIVQFYCSSIDSRFTTNSIILFIVSKCNKKTLTFSPFLRIQYGPGKNANPQQFHVEVQCRIVGWPGWMVCRNAGSRYDNIICFLKWPKLTLIDTRMTFQWNGIFMYHNIDTFYICTYTYIHTCIYECVCYYF